MFRYFDFVLVLFVMTLFLGACDKENTLNEDETPDTTVKEGHLIFGHFYGECFGEGCVEIFKIENDQLFEDSNDTYPTIYPMGDFYDGDFTALDNAKFELVEDLVDAFPSALLDETEKQIGIPDAGDWGGLYIEYDFDGVHQYWLLDQMKSNVPDYLHEFIDKVNDKISIINQ